MRESIEVIGMLIEKAVNRAVGEVVSQGGGVFAARDFVSGGEPDANGYEDSGGNWATWFTVGDAVDSAPVRPATRA